MFCAHEFAGLLDERWHRCWRVDDVLGDPEHEALRGGFGQAGHGGEPITGRDRRVGGQHLELFGGNGEADP